LRSLKKVFVFMMMAAFIVCLAAAAHSTPSTLVWIPTTDIQPAGQGHLGIDVYAPSKGFALTDYGVTYGTGKIEYGVDYLAQSGLEDPLRLNGKVLLKAETSKYPALAVGIFDLGGTAASNQAYILGSKTFSAGRLTLGYSNGKKSVLGTDNNMLLVGFDKTLSKKWWVGADYQSGQSGFGALSAGLQYTFTPTTSMILGYDRWNNRSLSDTITMQFDMNY